MIEVRWFDDEQTIIIYEVCCNWGRGEIFSAFQRGSELYQSVNYDVDTIFLLENVKRPPQALQRLGKILHKTRPLNLGFCVVISDDPIIQNIAKIGLSVWENSSIQYAVASSISDALSKIEASKPEEIRV